MIRKLSPKLAGHILIFISSALIVFHIVNILGLTPMNITWLGHVDTDRTKQIMGLFSIFINSAVILCAVVKCNYVRRTSFKLIVERILPFVYWWLVGNTVANLFSKTMFEVIVFTPVLVVLTICVYIIKSKPETQTEAV